MNDIIEIGFFPNLTQTINNQTWCLIDIYIKDESILVPFDYIIADETESVYELWITQKTFTYFALKYEVNSYGKYTYTPEDYKNHIKILINTIPTLRIKNHA